MKTTLTAYRSAVGLTLVAAFILLLPLLAMQMTDEMVWSMADFATAGVLLAGAGLTFGIGVRVARNATHRATIGLALVAALLLVWAELAVGVFGIPGISGS